MKYKAAYEIIYKKYKVNRFRFVNEVIKNYLLINII